MIFTTGKVHLSVASALNDPFECSLKEIGSEWIKNEVAQMKQAAIAGFVMQATRSIENKDFAFGMSHKKLSKVLKKLGSKREIDEKYRYFRKLLNYIQHPYPYLEDTHNKKKQKFYLVHEKQHRRLLFHLDKRS